MSLVKRQYDDFVWELKYRPEQLDQMILPARFVKQFNKLKSLGKLPNMLFSGMQGIGKTTLAFVLADEMDLSALYINMALDTSIDNIRSKLMDFATHVSMEGKQKVIIGDEFDRLSPQSIDSLKGAIEKCSRNCKFIFTSNHKNKLIAPLISRLQEIDFVFTKEERIKMKKAYWKRACTILKKEEVKFDPKAVGELVKSVFPDMRKILNKLQMLSLQGDINMGMVNAHLSTNTKDFFKYLKASDWSSIRQFVVDLPIDPSDFYAVMFQDLEKYIDSSSIPEAVIAIAKYQYESAFVADVQIPLCALAIELMAECKFKKDF